MTILDDFVNGDGIPFGCSVAIGLAVLVFFVWVATAFVLSLRADSLCMKWGFRDSNVTWNLQSYCVRRVNQTDEVWPLDSARWVKPK